MRIKEEHKDQVGLCGMADCWNEATHIAEIQVTELHPGLLPVCEKHYEQIGHTRLILPDVKQRNPKAPCCLVVCEGAYCWLVPECPYCGNRHIYYACKVGEDPRLYLGLIEPCCENRFREVIDKWGDCRLVEQSFEQYGQDYLRDVLSDRGDSLPTFSIVNTAIYV